MSGVLVILQPKNRISWEALAAGQELAAQVNQPLFAAAATGQGEDLRTELGQRQLACAYLVEHRALSEYTADGYVAGYEQIIRKLNPSFVLLPHTYQVRDFAPRLATRFGQSMIADVIGHHYNDGKPVFVRQLLQGKLNADYTHAGSGPCFVSIQAGAYRADTLAAGSSPAEVFTPQIDPGQIRSKPGERFRMSEQTVDLGSAPVIVSVGRGIKEKENIAIVEELAKAMGAELAASRPICDNGWLPMERQVGSSGQTVSPKLYLAVGISGAIQHLVGMKGSKAVIAINKDANAPIFEIADYGIVGDLFEVVPALTAAVKKARDA